MRSITPPKSSQKDIAALMTLSVTSSSIPTSHTISSQATTPASVSVPSSSTSSPSTSFQVTTSEPASTPTPLLQTPPSSSITFEAATTASTPSPLPQTQPPLPTSYQAAIPVSTPSPTNNPAATTYKCYSRHKVHRPAQWRTEVIKTRRSGKKSDTKNQPALPTFNNCGTTKTSGWRNHTSDFQICTTCLVYYNHHKVQRPTQWRTEVIKARRRDKKNNIKNQLVATTPVSILPSAPPTPPSSPIPSQAVTPVSTSSSLSQTPPPPITSSQAATTASTSTPLLQITPPPPTSPQAVTPVTKSSSLPLTAFQAATSVSTQTPLPQTPSPPYTSFQTTTAASTSSPSPLPQTPRPSTTSSQKDTQISTTSPPLPTPPLAPTSPSPITTSFQAANPASTSPTSPYTSSQQNMKQEIDQQTSNGMSLHEMKVMTTESIQETIKLILDEVNTKESNQEVVCKLAKSKSESAIPNNNMEKWVKKLLHTLSDKIVDTSNDKKEQEKCKTCKIKDDIIVDPFYYKFIGHKMFHPDFQDWGYW